MAFMLGGGGSKKKGPEISVASKIIRDTIRKGGRINEETFKKIMQAKLKEARTNSMNKVMDAKLATGRRSASATKSLEMMQEMYAAQDAKKERKEVIIVARRYHNGKIDNRGRIFDIAGNMVAKVNTKNGVMVSVNGEYMGKYDAKSGKVYATITGAIEKNSPYLIGQRSVKAKQKQEEESKSSAFGGFAFGSGGGMENHKAELDVWSRTPTDVFGRVKTDVWGRPAGDVWGRTQADGWGNQQVDIWGNQI